MTSSTPAPRRASAEVIDASSEVAEPVAARHASAETIGTLPPLPDEEESATHSPALARAAAGCYLVAAIAAGIALIVAWWQSIHMQTFVSATHLMTWTHPRPGSLASVLLAVAMMCIAAAMVAMPGILAVNTWLGRRWVRWGAIAGVVVGCAAVTLNAVAWTPMPFLVAGGVMVWMPRVRRWMDARVAKPTPSTSGAEPVRYGRVPQHM